jgi:hypothetical protein
MKFPNCPQIFKHPGKILLSNSPFYKTENNVIV